MTHLSQEALVLEALDQGDAETARHVEGCPVCRAEVRALREATALLRGPSSSRPAPDAGDCLEDVVVADFASGRLTVEARAPVVRHLLACDRCRGAVKATGRLLADPAVSREVDRLTSTTDGLRWRQWRRWSVPVGLAAAAVLVAIVTPRREGGPELREPTRTSTVAPEPIVPRASVGRVDRLVWSAVPLAERYRARVYDGEGSVVWTTDTPDTVAAVPDSVALVPGVSYFWRVEAEAEWNRWTASDLVEFRLTAPRR